MDNLSTKLKLFCNLNNCTKTCPWRPLINDSIKYEEMKIIPVKKVSILFKMLYISRVCPRVMPSLSYLLVWEITHNITIEIVTFTVSMYPLKNCIHLKNNLFVSVYDIHLMFGKFFFHYFKSQIHKSYFISIFFLFQ